MNTINGTYGAGGAEFGGNPAGAAGANLATVQSGETTLAKLAYRLGLTAASLLQANPQIQNPNNLKAGQDIHLPPMPAPAAQTALTEAPVETGSTFRRDIGADVLRARLRGAPVQYAGTAGGSGGPGAATAAAASRFVGMRLGMNDDGVVRVKREVGSTEGYSQRLEAVAVARLGGAEPAVVLQSTDGKWHAVETTVDLDAGQVFKANDTPILKMSALPSSGAIAKSTQNYHDALKKLQDLQDTRGAGDDADDREEKLREALKDVTRTRTQMAALVLGVDESEIQFNRSSFDRKPGKINLNPDLRGPYGVHGLQGKDADKEFEPGTASAIEIDLKALEKPAIAQGVLFHEISHLDDFELAQTWVTKYEQETKRMFVSGAGQPIFEKWLQAQAPKRLSPGDAELVADVAANRHATTEARAFSRTFLAALQAGSPDVATSQLVTYANNVKAGKYAVPATGSRVVSELTQELQTAYRQMTPDKQKQFAAAIEAAKKADPGLWIAQIKLP